MNKNGFFTDIILFGIMAFVIVMVLGVWYYGHGLIKDEITSINEPVVSGSDVNISEVGEDTFGNVHTGLATLKILSFALIFGMVLTMLVSNFIVRAHPVLFIPYLFFIILAFVLSVYISNTYEDLLTGEVFSATLQSFTASTFIVLHLPIWITVIGFVSIIIIMVGIIKDREGGL